MGQYAAENSFLKLSSERCQCEGTQRKMNGVAGAGRFY